MQLEMTPDAAERIRRTGGTVAIDLITSVGCGKPDEVAADTHLAGKDTTRYVRAHHDDVEVLLSPALVRSATAVRIDVTGPRWWRRLDVQLDRPLAPGTACAR